MTQQTYTQIPAHEFHIPVMGTGFTIDTPLYTAPFGISSVVSLVDDVLIEQMRKYHCEKAGEFYEPIPDGDDIRAQRITAYLNLLDKLIQKRTIALQQAPFEPNSDITKYYELLPQSPLKDRYQAMLNAKDPEKTTIQEELRQRIIPGSIDVNIMTKLNGSQYSHGKELPLKYAYALAALRGYANSTLCSSIVFSAGLNQSLYGYMGEFDDFFPDQNGFIKKKIILKVSDYRSAEIQGKFLAKKGLWVSEYRIESALNCGGHAFVNDGQLTGPILEKFKQNKSELTQSLGTIYKNALESLGKNPMHTEPEIRITVQGGIGTHEEHFTLLKHFHVNSTGWATPFLLVPEVTNVDDAHLKKLCEATEKEVKVDNYSPVGIPFWNLITSASEKCRLQNIKEGHPGSLCPRGYIKTNTEFTNKPICLASRGYLKLKLNHLKEENLSEQQYTLLKEDVLKKDCICHNLAGGATVKYHIDPQATPSICCGPNITNFSKIATLQEMVNHIYGRLSLLTTNKRPHMFIKELMIHIDFLREETKRSLTGILARPRQKLQVVKDNLLQGIEYYQDLAKQILSEQQDLFLEHLAQLRQEIENISI